jgi:Rad3-related DNA helicase
MLDYALTSQKRFTALGAPPGCGKSLFAFALAKLLGGRTVILTATLGLQNQYKRTFGASMADMRGRAQYSCWEGGNCEDGARMGCKDKANCPYLSAWRQFQNAQVGETNYAWWLAMNQYGTGAAAPDALICDEAALAPDWLSRSLDFHIGERECSEAHLKLQGPPGEEIPDWRKLADRVCASAEFALSRAQANLVLAGPANRERLVRALKHAESFVDRAVKLGQLDDNWICAREDGTDDGRIWRFECIWPGRYRERLFQRAPRVILMSASLRRKALGLLGIPHQEVDFKEWGGQFPAANRPVVWVPTAKVGRNMTDEEQRAWLGRIREILEWGADRNGLIHTVSYIRAKQIGDAFKERFNLYLNGAADPDSGTARDAYERFMRAPSGSTLVSPSFSTGWDFKYKMAEWQIMAKIAFPDTRSKIMQVRCGLDKNYGNYMAAQDLQQGSGRIVREYDDRGATLLIDDNWKWFRGAASEHMSGWFKVRTERNLPAPLPKL